ncbi:MAG: divergent polysaccharide deacetylase family protein, partial [Magnetococcales bacterium]|nr:divergent polysaccharide deacetylase family protein [Magnetococcales bacterium]
VEAQFSVDDDDRIEAFLPPDSREAGADEIGSSDSEPLEPVVDESRNLEDDGHEPTFEPESVTVATAPGAGDFADTDDDDRPVTLLKRVHLPEELEEEPRTRLGTGPLPASPDHAMRQEIEYEPEEENEYDPATNRWWILPLVAALVFFLAGIGTGRYLDGFGWPFGREASQTDKQTLVTMAVPPPGVPGALSGTSAPGTVNDAGPPVTTPAQGDKGAATPAQGDKGAATPAKDEATPAKGNDSGKEGAPGHHAGETGPLSDEVSAQPKPTTEEESQVDLQYEESLPHEPTPEEVPPATPPDTKGGPPRVAVVIDDLGYNGPVSLGIARLPEAITLAILPGGDFSRQVVSIGKSTHKEIILHQPMEPLGYPRVKPGPGALLNGMGHDEIRTILIRNLEKYPEVTGINNHMGSRLTQNREAMDTVMGVLKERNLFFLDSRTSQTSVGYARARVNGVPAARRDVFLDNVQKVSAIEARLAELERIARHTGRAIGIGHPHAETLTALRNWLPAATKRGIRVEGISHFLAGGEAGQARPAPTGESARDPALDKGALHNKPVKLKSETQLGHPLPADRPTPPPVPETPADRPAPPLGDAPLDRPVPGLDVATPVERPALPAPPAATIKPPVRPAPATAAKPPVRPVQRPAPSAPPPVLADEPSFAPPIIIRTTRPAGQGGKPISTVIMSPDQPGSVQRWNKPDTQAVGAATPPAPPPAATAPVPPAPPPAA